MPKFNAFSRNSVIKLAISSGLVFLFGITSKTYAQNPGQYQAGSGFAWIKTYAKNACDYILRIFKNLIKNTKNAKFIKFAGFEQLFYGLYSNKFARIIKLNKIKQMERENKTRKEWIARCSGNQTLAFLGQGEYLPNLD